MNSMGKAMGLVMIAGACCLYPAGAVPADSLEASLQDETPDQFQLSGTALSGNEIRWTWQTLYGYYQYDLHRDDHSTVTSITVPDPFNPPLSLSFTEGALFPEVLSPCDRLSSDVSTPRLKRVLCDDSVIQEGCED